MRRALLSLLALPLLAGCGGGAARPQLEHADAAALISLAHRIATEGACAQARDIPRLHARAIALVNAHRVPQRLQEPLLSGVNALTAPLCLPSVPASSTTPAVPAPARPAPHPHGPGHGHGHRHGHGHDG